MGKSDSDKVLVIFMLKHTLSPESNSESSVEAACHHTRNVCRNCRGKIRDMSRVIDF